MRARLASAHFKPVIEYCAAAIIGSYRYEAFSEDWHEAARTVGRGGGRRREHGNSGGCAPCRPLNLRQIEVFQAIMLAGSVSGAGRMLHVSQPAVSRVLALTESRLGYHLFERARGKL